MSSARPGPSTSDAARLNVGDWHLHGTTMTLVAVVLFLILNHAAIAGECPCPPTVDWAAVEAAWQAFVEAGDPTSAPELMWEFQASEVIVVPPEHQWLVDAIVSKQDVVLFAIDDQQSWAVQLGLRITRMKGYPDSAALLHRLGRLATDHPQTFLREIAKFNRENPCALGFCGIVQYFGTEEEIKNQADPRLEDVVERSNALASVDEPALSQIRDSCLGLLQVQEIGLRDSQFPRTLRRVDLDLSRFMGRPVSNISSTSVVAEATIGVDGKVQSVKILRGGDPDIDKAVSDNLHEWLFEPKLENGVAVEFQFVFTVRFHPY
jgi:hypothetical protein